MLDVDNASDASLVVAIGRWHEPALAEAFRRHGAAVSALAARVLSPSDGAEDVTQEVFLKLWEHPDRFDAERGSLRAFLLMLAHNRAVDMVRSERARHHREERDALTITAAGHGAEHYAWEFHVGDRVRRALGCLPESERVTIELAYFGGNSYREVAARLGKPEGTVKGQIRTGLGRLRVALRDEM